MWAEPSRAEEQYHFATQNPLCLIFLCRDNLGVSCFAMWFNWILLILLMLACYSDMGAKQKHVNLHSVLLTLNGPKDGGPGAGGKARIHALDVHARLSTEKIHFIFILFTKADSLATKYARHNIHVWENALKCTTCKTMEWNVSKIEDKARAITVPCQNFTEMKIVQNTICHISTANGCFNVNRRIGDSESLAVHVDRSIISYFFVRLMW